MTELFEPRLAMDFAAVALDIVSAEVGSTRQRIVDLAVAKVGCQSAALWQVKPTGGLRLDASTDPELIQVMSRIAASSGSLARACVEQGRNLVVEDFATESRWPEFARQVMAHTAIRSAAGFCLSAADEIIGVLSLYSDAPRAMTSQQIALASIYAAHAAIALHDAFHVEQAENLRRALDSNRRIGMALGILIAQHKVTEEQAFDLLRVASQNNHLKLHDVAEEVILTGAAPEMPARKSG